VPCPFGKPDFTQPYFPIAANPPATIIPAICSQVTPPWATLLWLYQSAQGCASSEIVVTIDIGGPKKEETRASPVAPGSYAIDASEE